ncbi:MAG: alpha-glucan family phosphorylase, partial [Bacteriovoracia bacterium]
MNAIQLPSKLKDLNTIAYNCWWSWNEDAQDLFRELNDQSWQKFRNPVAVLNDTEQAVFAKMAKDAAYVKRVNEVYKRMKSYLDQKETWYAQNFPAEIDKPLVYFSTEYAIHESMATYSGGLGVLSGDHVKSASDLGLPMSFVGLFYRKGYFVQEINEQGQQVDVYIDNVPERLPVKPVQKNGEDVVVEVDFPGRKLFAKAWQMEVGRATMYLLDTDIDQNEGLDRELTHRLYGGDREMRIGQEVVLGIGGVR